jgi:glucan phosphoethanolaminetransferase (alkaline phosphatase superfamily)
MSIIGTSPSAHKWRLRHFFVLFLLLSVLAQLYPVLFTQPIRFALRITLSNALLIMVAAAIYRHRVGRIISVLLVMLLSFNFAVSFGTWRVYQSEFNAVFAMSILATDAREIDSMSGMFLNLLPFIFGYAAITFLAIKTTAESISSRTKIIATVLLGLFFVICITANGLKEREDLEVYYPLSSRILTWTPFYVGSEFIIAERDNKLAQNIQNAHVTYPVLSKKETGIENYVVIVGESARRSNMNLYGFGLDTTPVESRLRQSMLVFEHARAPASATVFAVPMILSQASPDDFTETALADNVINIANKTGFNTYWISAQGNSGKSNNYIVAIASLSQHVQWITTRYDDDLLPEFDKALAAPGRKLIFLHINGSHEMACDRYPASAAWFHTNNEYEDCYNNAIRFTDSFIGEVTKRLNNSTSSLLYFSDHGLEKNPQLTSIYMHGSRNPSKEAFDVPQFIWYSPLALSNQPRKTGEIQEPYSTADNYWLMLSWLGISTGIINRQSPLEADYQPATTFPVIDGGRHIFEYSELRDNFSSPGRQTQYRKTAKGSL